MLFEFNFTNITPMLAVLFFGAVLAELYLIFRLREKYGRALGVERRQAAEIHDLALGLDSAFDTIFITDEDGIIVYVNRAFERNTGYSADEVVGMAPGCVNLWGGQVPFLFYRKLAENFNSQHYGFRGIFVNAKKNGTEYVAETKIAKVAGSEPALYVVVERDITETYELDKAKASFVSLVAHQLRTPISIVRWNLDLLRGGDFGSLNEKQVAVAGKLSVASARLADTVSLLLDISRAEMKSFSIKPEKIDLADFVRQAAEAHETAAKDKGVELTVDVKEGLRPMIDRRLFRLVADNLIENAIKYTPAGGSIAVLAEFNSGAGRLTLSVSDTGCGVPDDEKDKIFTKGFRASNALGVSANGTGLGLYLVKQIVELMDGDVCFYDRMKGHGTVFEVSVPVKAC